MADSSTTTRPILDLIAGGRWARRQLPSGIKDVSVASELRRLLTLVRVVFIDTLAIAELDGRFLHSQCSDLGSDCGRLLGSTPATQRYKVCPETTIPHGAIGSQEGGRIGQGRLGSGPAQAGQAGLRLDVNLPVY